jgi:hypothetical protein
VFPISKTICETPRAELFFGGEKEKAAAGAANIEDELCAWAPNYIFFVPAGSKPIDVLSDSVRNT